jgi:lipopolysaccharide biosynthesis regulator YciM
MSANGALATADSVLHAPVQAGSRGRGEYRCCDCGYGIVTHGVVPLCPMCNAEEWLPAPARDTQRAQSAIVEGISHARRAPRRAP